MVGTKPDPKASQVNTKQKLEILYIKLLPMITG